MLDLLRDYGLDDFYLELSTRDDSDKFIGEDEDWEEATAALERGRAIASGLELVPDPGGAAFYGPKISVQARDAIGRTWQMSTIQVDFNQPKRFELEYQGDDGERHQPVMIHRALFGSIERFFGVLTEHYAGAFPAWLSPVQVVGIPIRDGARRLPARVSPSGCAARASGPRSTPPTTGCRRRSATAQQHKVPFMFDRRADATSRPALSRSATATASNATACRSTTRSSRWRATSPPGRPSRTRSTPRRSSRPRHDRPDRTAGRRRPGRLATAVDAQRLAYIQGEGKADGCPFCQIPAMADEDGLVVHRGEAAYAVLNLYPYNSGHLMVVPVPARRRLPGHDAAETAEIGTLTQTAMRVLRTVSGAQGFNIGMNQGVVAGAGIAAHLHQHVVPRWGGDTNFMPVVARTKVLPQLLRETRALLADAWPVGD